MCWCAIISVMDVALQEEGKRSKLVVIVDDVCEIGVAFATNVGQSASSMKGGDQDFRWRFAFRVDGTAS